MAARQRPRPFTVLLLAEAIPETRETLTSTAPPRPLLRRRTQHQSTLSEFRIPTSLSPTMALILNEAPTPFTRDRLHTGLRHCTTHCSNNYNPLRRTPCAHLPVGHSTSDHMSLHMEEWRRVPYLHQHHPMGHSLERMLPTRGTHQATRTKLLLATRERDRTRRQICCHANARGASREICHPRRRMPKFQRRSPMMAKARPRDLWHVGHHAGSTVISMMRTDYSLEEGLS